MIKNSLDVSMFARFRSPGKLCQIPFQKYNVDVQLRLQLHVYFEGIDEDKIQVF